MPNIASIFSDFTLAWDIGILIFFWFVAFFYGLSIARRRLILLLISLYFGFALMDLAPYWRDVAKSYSFAEPALFAVVVGIIFYLLSGSILTSSFRILKRDESPLWHLLLLSFVTVGFLTSSILAFFPISYYNNFSTITRELFIFNDTHFWWAAAGIVVLALLRRKSDSRRS